MFRTLALLLTSLLTVSMLAGCGGDDSESEEEVLLANVIGVNPPSGSEIAVNGGITLTFDNTPTDVAVSGYTVTVAGKTATIVGPFRSGPLVLTVTWADGARTLNYTTTRPDCCAPLIFIGGTVKDGDTDVDPEAINTDLWRGAGLLTASASVTLSPQAPFRFDLVSPCNHCPPVAPSLRLTCQLRQARGQIRKLPLTPPFSPFTA